MSQQRIQGLRKQHGDILQITARLRQALQAGGSDDHLRLGRLVAELGQALDFHFGIEDGVLYPELLASSDAAVVGLARRFLKEMGGLKSACQAYHDAWPAERIAAARERFASETLAVLGILERRIRRENEELYPLLER
jgi:hypothetical protein